MSRCLAGGVVVLGFLALTWPGAAGALDLTGVLIYGADQQGTVKGPIWHTSFGRTARVLGLTRWPPPGLRGIPFANAEHGDVDITLLSMSHTTTLFWQYLPGEFPQAMVLNLYFNGDNTNPGIGVVVPLVYGLTHFYQNPSAITLSLDATDVDNTAGLSVEDGGHRAHLGVAFYFPSTGEIFQWRPADFVLLDRVGTDRLAPDGSPDGIMVFELVVEPVAPAPTAPPGPPSGPAGIVEPPVAQVGPDQWVAPSTPTLGAMPPPPTLAAASTTETPAAAPSTPTSMPTEYTRTLSSPGPTAANSTTPAAGTPTPATSGVPPSTPTKALPTPAPTA
jgi:hypothetical protein